jgi:putative peptidoglycan lipid II flippase
VLFWAVPSSAGFIILREPLVRAVFYWGGKFTLADVSSVASILVLFSVSIISQSVVAILNRAFYALQDTKTPLLIGLASAVTNLGLGAIFYMFTNLGASGMALSYSIISTINAIILLIKINRKTNGIHTEKVISFFVRALPAALIMYAAVMFLEMIPVSLVTKGLQLLYLLAEIIIAAVVYTGIMLLLKAEDAIYLKHLIKQRLNM